jgi:hypothetical protein
MGEREDKVAELLHEAGETHHRVYRIVDGDDPDWASWYADWLIELSELPDLLGTKPVRSELVWLLVQCDKDFTADASGGRWEDDYARRLVGHLAAAA